MRAALDLVEDKKRTTQARTALAEYEADRTVYHKDNLLTALTPLMSEQDALALLGIKPPRKGLVWCCSTIGWVTPQERFDHRWDAYSDL